MAWLLAVVIVLGLVNNELLSLSALLILGVMVVFKIMAADAEKGK